MQELTDQPTRREDRIIAAGQPIDPIDWDYLHTVRNMLYVDIELFGPAGDDLARLARIERALDGTDSEAAP